MWIAKYRLVHCSKALVLHQEEQKTTALIPHPAGRYVKTGHSRYSLSVESETPCDQGCSERTVTGQLMILTCPNTSTYLLFYPSR